MEIQKMQNPFYSEMPSNESIDSFIQDQENQIKSIHKNMDYRMANYYNCVDDYSFGGRCDQAASESLRECQTAISVLKTQKEEGVQIETFTNHVLTDLEGNVVSERLVDGRFGRCWIIGEGDNVQFIGTAKKMATYNKKGYKLMIREYQVEYYYLTRKRKNGLVTRGRVLSSILKEVDSSTDISYPSTHLNSIVYFAILRQEEFEAKNLAEIQGYDN